MYKLKNIGLGCDVAGQLQNICLHQWLEIVYIQVKQIKSVRIVDG